MSHLILQRKSGTGFMYYDGTTRTISGTETIDPTNDRITSQNSTTLTLAASNASNYPTNSLVMIITMYDSTAGTYASNVGTYEFAQVLSNNSSNQVTLRNSLTNTYEYTNCYTYIVRPNYYENLTVPDGTEVNCSSWIGGTQPVRGITFLAADTININGTVGANFKGFRGGDNGTGGGGNNGGRGESYYSGIYNALNNNTLAGAGGAGIWYDGGANGDIGMPGAGGGYGTDGADYYLGEWVNKYTYGGVAFGDTLMSKMYLGPGGGGGAGDTDVQVGNGGAGGAGGGIVVLYANNVNIGATGQVQSLGQQGFPAYDPGDGEPGAGGSGAGGSILFTGKNEAVSVVNNGIITTAGGPTQNLYGYPGGAGGDGVTAVKGSLSGNAPIDTIYA